MDCDSAAGGPAPSHLPHRLLFDRMLIATVRQDAGGRAEWSQRTGKTPLVGDATHQVHAGLVRVKAEGLGDIVMRLHFKLPALPSTNQRASTSFTVALQSVPQLT